MAMSHRFLEFIEERGITATVFIVGEIARSHPSSCAAWPKAVTRSACTGCATSRSATWGRPAAGGAQRGSGIAARTPRRFPCRAFAPRSSRSLRATEWAVEQIAGAGFAYSSSVLPAANPLHGWPGAPRGAVPLGQRPDRAAVPGRRGGPAARFPSWAGIYLRYVPLALARRFAGPLERAIRRLELLAPLRHRPGRAVLRHAPRRLADEPDPAHPPRRHARPPGGEDRGWRGRRTSLGQRSPSSSASWDLPG